MARRKKHNAMNPVTKSLSFCPSSFSQDEEGPISPTCFQQAHTFQHCLRPSRSPRSVGHRKQHLATVPVPCATDQCVSWFTLRHTCLLPLTPPFGPNTF